jgi:hypothetical protein
MDRNFLRSWFTSLEADHQYLLLKLNYDICNSTIGLKDNENIVKNLNKKWENKLENIHNDYKSKVNELVLENQAIKNNNFNDVKKVVDDLYDNLLVKFSGNKKGQVNEKLIYDMLLEKYPKCEIKNVSGSNGCGDIYMNINGIRFMVECKMQQESILRSDPDKVFDRFKKESIEAINNNIVDISIFISAGSKIIPNYGTFESEEIITKRGKSYLIYISDIYNYPERIDAAVELGIQFSSNITDETTIYSKVLEIGDKMNKLSKYIYKLETNVKNEHDILNSMKTELNCIEGEFKSSLDNVRQLDEIIDIIQELIKKNGFRDTTTKIIEDEFKSRCIPLRKIRDNGGIKKLKILANKKLTKKSILNL